MRNYYKSTLVIITFLSLFFGNTVQGKRESKNSTSPYSKLEELIKKYESDYACTIGVSVLHDKTGWHFTYNGEKRFCLASVYKIPLLFTCLDYIDSGKLSWDQIISLQPEDIRRYGILDQLPVPGISLTLRNCMSLLITHSDNTATDILFKLVGGPQAVQKYLQKIGIIALRVDRTVLEQMADIDGISRENITNSLTLEQYTKYANAVSRFKRKRARKQFLLDERDTGTPKEITQLLYRLVSPTVPSVPFSHRESYQWLLNTLYLCRDRTRLVARLPKKVRVAHKTGTLPVCVNDCGIIELLDNQGYLIISICITKQSRSIENYKRALSHITRVLYDTFLGNYSKK